MVFEKKNVSEKKIKANFIVSNYYLLYQTILTNNTNILTQKMCNPADYMLDLVNNDFEGKIY